VQGLVALGDAAVLAAAWTARELGIEYNLPAGVENCRTKLRQRQVLSAASVGVPDFFPVNIEEGLESALHKVKFPCVVKPMRLSASQGVIRANNPAEFRAAAERVRALLQSPEVRQTGEQEAGHILVEAYIPGREVAAEALLTRGQLRVLAIFDKPAPLEGPYFEETIYVTPSLLPIPVQQEITTCAAAAVRALGLRHGPIHAEFRVNQHGVWVLEVSPRPIGGLCSRALRFGPQHISLEELLVKHALGMEGSDLEREPASSGVMMIPVPRSGVLESVSGEEAARATPGIHDLQITARLHDFIAAWPEGSSYLGFLFARGGTPEEVEAALAQAHAKLQFRIAARLPVAHPVTSKIPGTWAAG
jgi:biotin carboxylase